MPHEHQLHNVIRRIPGEGFAVTPSEAEGSQRSDLQKPVQFAMANVQQSKDLSTARLKALRSR